MKHKLTVKDGKKITIPTLTLPGARIKWRDRLNNTNEEEEKMSSLESDYDSDDGGDPEVK